MNKFTLDLGCGDNPRGSINLDRVKTTYCNIVADIHYLPFKNEVFSYLWCLQVLEHVEDPIKAINEIKRVIQENKTVWIGFPKKRLHNNMLQTFLELFLNFPFSLTLKQLRRWKNRLKACKAKNPRYHHKNIVTVELIALNFKVLKTVEYGDILYEILKHGRKSRYFRSKPQVNTALAVKCYKN